MITFTELLESFAFNEEGRLPNAIDPTALLSGIDIVGFEITTNRDTYVVALDDDIEYVEETDDWFSLCEGIDANVFITEAGLVLLSFYPVIDGKIDTTDSRMESIACFTKQLKK